MESKPIEIMKKTTVYLLCVSVALLVMSCNQTEHKTETHQKAEESQTTKTSERHTARENELTLNNGKLWQANPETTEGVNKMIDIIHEFSNTKNVEAYSVLSEELKTEFGLIFKRCTMKGEAHNQLHNFLIPINAQFKNLESENLEQCQKAYQELKKHLSIYSNFFE